MLRGIRSKKLVMFFLAFFAYFSFYLCRTNMPFVSKTLINMGMLDVTKWGLLVSYGAIVYGVSKGLSGALADKFDLKKILLFGLGTTSMINFMVPSLKSATAITAIWIINQFVQGMAYTSCVKTLLNWYGADKKNKAYTYWSASHRLGTSAAGFIATWCLAHAYWQGAFIVPASITGVMFVFIGLFYKQRPDNFVQERKKEGSVEPSFKEIGKYIFTNRNLLILAITSMGIYYGYFFMLNWLIIFFTDQGFSITKSTGLLAFLPLLGCFGGIASGYVIDGIFKGRILPVITISAAIVIALLSFLYFGCTTLSTAWLVFVMLMLGFFTDIPQILGSLASTNFVTKQFQGSALGFVGLCHYIGVSLSGRLTAYTVKEYGWGVPFSITIAFILFSVFGCIILFNQERIF
ncbi:MAG: MFS transporter, partial [Endomicrobium sp.]|nr:MFS transporter [Endomicrobium sp.]